MFGYKSNIDKLKEIKMDTIDNMTMQWYSFVEILSKCKRKDLKKIDIIFQNCSTVFQNELYQYKEKMQNVDMTSPTRGKQLFEYLDVIQNIYTSFDDAINIKEVQFNDIIVDAKFSFFKLEFTHKYLLIHSECYQYINEVAKKYFTKDIKILTEKIENLLQKQKDISSQIKKDGYIDDEYTYDDKNYLDNETKIILSSQKHPDVVNISNEIEKTLQERRKLMEMRQDSVL